MQRATSIRRYFSPRRKSSTEASAAEPESSPPQESQQEQPATKPGGGVIDTLTARWENLKSSHHRPGATKRNSTSGASPAAGAPAEQTSSTAANATATGTTEDAPQKPVNGSMDNAAEGDGRKPTPIFNADDLKFLRGITDAEEEETPPALPARPSRGKDAQMALMDGADQIPLPASPSAEEEEAKKLDMMVEGEGKKESEEAQKKEGKKAEKVGKKAKNAYWTYLPNWMVKDKDKKKKGSAASGENGAEDPASLEQEARDEEKDLSKILDQLNLSAVNNRVFSFSKESQDLLDRFVQVLKDIVNGVPTAYDDLEKLLTRSESQLSRMYGDMPPWVQSLVKMLPAKMLPSIAPELFAEASEKPGNTFETTETTTSKPSEGGKEKKKKSKVKIPSLKRLVTEQGAVAGMLRSIVQFLQMRFPALMTGTNVVLSVAVFLLLFVFWYCHKRGREVRLARAAEAAQAKEANEAEARRDAEAEAAFTTATAGDSTAKSASQLSPADAVPEASDLEYSVSDLEDEAQPQSTAARRASSMGGKLGEGAEEPDHEPPISINVDPAVPDKPSAAVADLPSVVNLPEPGAVPLPEQKKEEKEVLEK
ncbi:hypothetical protein BDY21DRAFT_371473 [Lineolata rhizophorae]|uniref:Uncharacterized protein n=1 Tax=Lineolata rhizophorae TaxID=578093 RepID=A0A6A6P1X0_9PEZI|nr:hypothetical protein BDY21DRAFT_371473 [Lineolata rhizophorae]